jgi:hypothetical protein
MLTQLRRLALDTEEMGKVLRDLSPIQQRDIAAPGVVVARPLEWFASIILP